jgi:hypothetical protein
MVLTYGLQRKEKKRKEKKRKEENKEPEKLN